MSRFIYDGGGGLEIDNNIIFIDEYSFVNKHTIKYKYKNEYHYTHYKFIINPEKSVEIVVT